MADTAGARHGVRCQSSDARGLQLRNTMERFSGDENKIKSVIFFLKMKEFLSFHAIIRP